MYTNNYHNVILDIKIQKQTNQKFAEYLQKTEAEAKKKQLLQMNALLITPVQRLPRYTLLLKELISHTPKEHSDYPLLVKANESIKKVTEEVNQRLLEHENRFKTVTITKMVKDIPLGMVRKNLLFSPSRKKKKKSKNV